MQKLKNINKALLTIKMRLLKNWSRIKKRSSNFSKEWMIWRTKWTNWERKFFSNKMTSRLWQTKSKIFGIVIKVNQVGKLVFLLLTRIPPKEQQLRSKWEKVKEILWSSIWILHKKNNTEVEKPAWFHRKLRGGKHPVCSTANNNWSRK